MRNSRRGDSIVQHQGRPCGRPAKGFSFTAWPRHVAGHVRDRGAMYLMDLAKEGPGPPIARRLSSIAQKRQPARQANPVAIQRVQAVA